MRYANESSPVHENVTTSRLPVDPATLFSKQRFKTQVTHSQRKPLGGMSEHEAFRTVLEGTASATGQAFFKALVQKLAEVLDTAGAWVTEYLPEDNRLRALAFWLESRFVDHYEYDVYNTPCERVIEQKDLLHYPDKLIQLFPLDPDLKGQNAVSYMGVPLLDVDGKVLGHLAVLDTRPMPKEPMSQTIFRIFAARAAAELQRLRAEADVREREEKLGRLVTSAMDAIIELDDRLQISLMNPAAEQILKCDASDAAGADFNRFLSEESRKKLSALIDDLTGDRGLRRYLWIPGGLTAVDCANHQFPAEATLSCSEVRGQRFFTLILRNVNDRLEAERKIHSLSAEAEYLREELSSLRYSEDILGNSPAVVRLLQDIQQVAATDASVLIQGETGTGKELVARAIHANSKRSDKPLIKVNCAAIPGNLMESEFFGHEQGAFTGATKRRDGRFALADGGTIFLDEIGEMPMDLQVKLLRVLQEGEFERVGSSATQVVDVRVIAATNRDLKKQVADGNFREDLFYRLNVFPIEVPPLRDRGEDIEQLASMFAEKFSQRIGRPVHAISADSRTRLRTYHWPGNVRELQNVIERAVITSVDGHLNFDRSLPTRPVAADAAPSEEEFASDRVHTVEELQQLERDNLVRALKRCGWRVSGKDGAAMLLGMNPSTLSSRLKALHIERPRHGE